MSSSYPGAGSSAPIRSDFADDADMRELVDMFVEELPQRIAEMEQALDGGDLDLLRTLTHQLKGAGGGYGFQVITEVAREAEGAIKDGSDLEKLQQNVAELIAVCKRVER